jgi:hypothetical protein
MTGRISTAALAVLAMWAATTRAQYIAPGSTPEGDYLRGVGIAAYGMGYFNRQTAEANAINVNTAIVWNEYVAAVARNEIREKAEYRASVFAERARNYKAILDRILKNPEELDVMNGNALNAVLEQLNNRRVDESTARFGTVPLPADVVRRIPFRLNEQAVRFSMKQLAARGKDKWPIALRTETFAQERKDYERAIDYALEQQIEGKMLPEAIAAVEQAVNALINKKYLVNRPNGDLLSIEVNNYLHDLQEVPRLLKSHDVERVIGDMEKYSGRTVNDLRVFMQEHKLRFAGARTVEERRLYPDLYAALFQMNDALRDAPTNPKK